MSEIVEQVTTTAGHGFRDGDKVTRTIRLSWRQWLGLWLTRPWRRPSKTFEQEWRVTVVPATSFEFETPESTGHGQAS